jgi:hypothetical protein
MVDANPAVLDSGWNYLHYTTRVLNRRAIAIGTLTDQDDPFLPPEFIVPDGGSATVAVRGHGVIDQFSGGPPYATTWETLPFTLSNPGTGVSQPVVITPAVGDEFAATWELAAPALAAYEDITFTALVGADRASKIVMPGAMLFIDTGVGG